MNLWNLKTENPFTKSPFHKLIVLLLLVVSASTQAWEVDFSRRINQDDTKEVIKELRWPASSKTNEELFSEIAVQKLSGSMEPATNISLIQTDEGFVPDTLRLRKDTTYKIYVVNVNEKFKNASFILDAFGKSFGTFFGKTKSFEITTKVNGIFTFLSPESGAQGKIIVFSDKDNAPPVISLNSNEAKK